MSHSARLIFRGCLMGSAVTAFAALGAAQSFEEGDLFVATCGSTIHHIDPETFTVTLFADGSDGLTCASGLMLSHQGRLLATSRDDDVIREYLGDGTSSIVLDAEEGIDAPFGANGLAVDGRGRHHIANTGTSEILRFDDRFHARAVLADAGDGLVSPEGLAFDFRGNLLVANRGGAGEVFRVTRQLDENDEPIVELFDQLTGEDPLSVTIRPNRDIYVLCVSGALYRYEDGFSANRTLLAQLPAGGGAIASALNGSTLYHVNDNDASLRIVDPETGADTVVATGLTDAAGVVVIDKTFSIGDIYIATHRDDEVLSIDPDTRESTLFADSDDGLACPGSIGFLDDGRMIVSSYLTDEVFEFDIEGNATRVLGPEHGLSGPFGANGIVQDLQGRVYISNFDSGEILRFSPNWAHGQVFADPGDGLVFPDGLAFTATEDLLVANRGSGGEIRRIKPDGTASVFDVIPGEDCYSIAVRNNSDVYVACESGTVYRYPFGIAPLREVFGTFGDGSGNIAIDMGPTDETLYIATRSDESLRRVDLATGDVRIMQSRLGDIAAIQVFGDECPAVGLFHEFGEGLAGAGGIVPALHGSGDPTPGGTITLEIRDFVGRATAFLFLGFATEETEVFGGTLYVALKGYWDLLLFRLPGTPGVPGEGDLDLPLLIPDTDFACLDVYFQVLAIDDAAIQGISMSQALLMQIGE